MDIRTIKKVLPVLIRNKVVPFLWGSQGVGKTQVVKQIAKDLDLGCIVIHTATQDVGDLVGLLAKDEATGQVYHMKPKWFPTSGKGIIYLDELNRAPQDVLQSLFSFITEGRIHTHVLPPGWRVVAAGNYQSDRFTTTDTSDAAWLSRFCHLDFTPSVDEWILYAEDRGLWETASFIRQHPTMLELSAKDAGRLDTSFIVPDRRAWLEGVGALEKDGSLPEEARYEVFSGIVGTAAAACYMSDKAKTEKAITLGQIFAKYEGKLQQKVWDISRSNEKRFDLLNQPIDELILRLEKTPHILSGNKNLDNLKEYLFDIPRELSMKAFSKLSKAGKFHGKDALLNDPKYIARFK